MLPREYVRGGLNLPGVGGKIVMESFFKLFWNKDTAGFGFLFVVLVAFCLEIPLVFTSLLMIYIDSSLYKVRRVPGLRLLRYHIEVIL